MTQHECKKCRKSFGSEEALGQHMQDYDHSKLTKCPDCGEAFTSEDAYQSHQKMHRNQVQEIVASTSWKHLAGIGILALIAIGIFMGVTELTGPRPGKTYKIQGQQHIQPAEPHPSYNSNPPTSGWHYPREAGWGFYSRKLPDERVVHNLEHGGIWISYTSSVSQEAQDKLRSLARKYPRSVIVTKRDANDAPIAVASWGRLMELQKFDGQRIKTFIEKNMNHSPEPEAGR